MSALLALAPPGARAQPAPYDEVARLVQAGQIDDALARAQQYLQGQPRDPQMRFLLGVAQGAKGQTEAALQTYQDLTQAFPELPEPYNNLAVLHAAAGRYEQALAALQAALRANPNYAVAHENLGDVHARLAERAWARSQQIDPGNARLAPKLRAVQGVLQSTPPAR